MFLIYDTETTGLPQSYKAPITDTDNWPRLVQLAWQLHDGEGNLVSRGNHIVKPEGFTIPFNSVKVHGITTERATEEGISLQEVMEVFQKDFDRATHVVGHNIEFDINILGSELVRLGAETEAFMAKASIDTKNEGTDFCAIPGGKGGRFKWPTLTQLHEKLFGEGFGDAHDAAYDVDATSKCFFGLVKAGVIEREGLAAPSAIHYEAPKLEKANFDVAEIEIEVDQGGGSKAQLEALKDENFIHLHVHSQFSILQSTSNVDSVVNHAKEMGMPAIAITDHGNMMHAFSFVRAAKNAGIKAIVGCDFNLCQDHANKKVKDDGFQTTILAKNKTGYHNLAKLSSLAFMDGFYYVPRIDREQLLTYKEDLIVLTGGLWGEIPSLILNVGEAQAEEAFVWYKEHFGDDFYAELNRHGLEEEQVVNDTLLRFCEKYGVRYVAANNTYYTRKEDAASHDILLCVKDAENQSRPKKYVGKRGREFRFGFPNDEFYLKSPEEMKHLFADLPQAILSTQEIADKCEEYVLQRDVLLPAYDIPEVFVDEQDAVDGGKRGENAFLRHLTYVGAEKRYGEITDEIRERLDFELATIEKTGYPGYFLIVQDFTTKAREMDVSVGPGRGSAAGSAVAYCIGITNVDPIEYDLLFERFLNPDRVSMPDIDIDFDDEGRQRVIDYVIEKYGKNQVAQIITYGTMAAKSSIRDTARVMELPLSEADRLAKLIPDISLSKIFGLDDKALMSKLKDNQDDFNRAQELIKIAKQNNLESETVNTARKLEGSVRNTGIHACGVIITPDDITNFVPVATAKDSNMCCTQFDNAVAEDAGLLKMDFLGLKTLTLIKDAVKNVKLRHGIDLDPDSFPLDDEKTYELFQRGETVGIFQYESAGMQKYLKDLKPTKFADLIAMNALYRPGPLEYIPSFVRRKHGTEPIIYDLEACKEYLEETYGITVYQEQVMLLSQKLAGFTKGEADTLRKAMGKKKLDLLAKMKPQFLDQGNELGHDKKILEKIWKDWEAFASYAFNKSHSTCYAWVAYQTAYLKANYPAEYMASVLSNNMNDIKSVTFFMEECKRMGIDVLGPDVNESAYKFAVNEQGAIRCGMGAMKGVGEGAVRSIVENREESRYQSLFDFARKVSLKDCNKRVFESLALGGAFDEFGLNRAQYFGMDEKGRSLLENAIRYGNAHQDGLDSAQVSLFGESEDVELPEPHIPEAEEWSIMDKLSREKEVVGIYISGHPLDEFKLEMQHLCSKGGLKVLNDLETAKKKGDLSFGGMLSDVAHRTTKNGKPFGVFQIEDYEHGERFFLFGEDYIKFKNYLVDGWFLFIQGRVQSKRFNEHELEFKIHTVELLADVREKKARRITLQIDLSMLTDDVVEQVTTLCESHSGSCGMTIQIKDLGVGISMPSRTTRVELSNEFLNGIEELKVFDYLIHTK